MENRGSLFENLTFIVTDRCTSGCRYCVQQRGKDTIDISAVLRSLYTLRPRLRADPVIGFYGGEPLLEFETIRRIAGCLQKGRLILGVPSFSITTCGTGLDEKGIDFMAHHSFSLTLSLNGTRMQGDARYRRQRFDLIRRIKARSLITLSLNMVLEPERLDGWISMIKPLAETGVESVSVVPDIRNVWDSDSFFRLERAYDELSQTLVNLGKRFGTGLVPQFAPAQPGLLRCPGGTKRLSVSPAGEFWGCYLARDFFFRYPRHPRLGKYRMGTDGKLEEEKAAAYQSLRQCYFTAGDVFCINCPQVNECVICPFTAGLVSGEIGRVPLHLCTLEKLRLEYRRRLLRALA